MKRKQFVGSQLCGIFVEACVNSGESFYYDVPNRDVEYSDGAFSITKIATERLKFLVDGDKLIFAGHNK